MSRGCVVEERKTRVGTRNASAVHNTVLSIFRSSQYLVCLNMNFGYYFDNIFAGNELGGDRYRVLFEQLGDLGFERRRGATSMTVGVLMVLRSYNDRKKLEVRRRGDGAWSERRED